MKPFYKKLETVAKALRMEIGPFASMLGIKRGELEIIKNGTQFTEAEERTFWVRANRKFGTQIEIPENWRVLKEFDCRLLTKAQVPIFIRLGDSESGLVFKENVDEKHFPGERWANIYRGYERTCAGTLVNGKWKLRVGKQMWPVDRVIRYLRDTGTPLQCDRCGVMPLWEGEVLVHSSALCPVVRVDSGERWRTIEKWNRFERYFVK